MLDGEAVCPSKVVCIGRNYADHVRELNNEMPTEPVFFIKPNSAIGESLRCGGEHAVHYEGEIVLCVRQGTIAGVGFGLDLTRREVQTILKEKGLPWERAKAFDGAAVFSDFVSFSGDVSTLRLELYINDTLVQAGGYELMLYKPDQVMSEITGLFTLYDNDLVMTGTPKGVGIVVQGDKFCGKVFAADTLLVEATWVAGP